MKVKLISVPVAQLARLLGLVRAVEPAKLEHCGKWALLVRGRGFTRLLEQEILYAPNLIRPAGWSTPRPMTFFGKKAAVAYGRHLGLLPKQKTWSVTTTG